MVMPHGPLGGGRTTVAMSTPPTEPSSGSVDGPQRRWVMAVLVAVLVLGLVALAARTSSEDNPTEPSLVGPTTTAVAAPTAAPTTVALVTPVVGAPVEPGPGDRAGNREDKPGDKRDDRRDDKKPKD